MNCTATASSPPAHLASSRRQTGVRENPATQAPRSKASRKRQRLTHGAVTTPCRDVWDRPVKHDGCAASQREAIRETVALARHRLGPVARHGLQAAAGTGVVLMTGVGTVLTLAGLGWGALPCMGLGALILVGCLAVGVTLHITTRRRLVPAVRRDLLPVLLAHRELLRQQAPGSYSAAELLHAVDDTIAMVTGGWGYALHQALRGAYTHAVDGAAYAWQRWQARRLGKG